MTAAFKDVLHQQLRTVFGNRRYWLHIGLWLLVLATCFPYASDFSRGIVISIDNSKQADSTQKSAADRTISQKAATRLTYVANDSAGLITDTVIGVTAGATIVYTFLLWIIPYARYRHQKRILLGAFLLIAVLLLSVIVGGSIAWGVAETQNQLRTHAAPVNYQPFIHLILSGFLALVIIAAFFSGYYFIDLYDQQKTLNRYQKAFAAKMQAETAFLKMQINPHFLFNSLNNIYALTLTKSPQAPVLARRLQTLLRYMLEDCTQETVPLAEELAFLKNYIALEQLRNPQGQVQIDFTLQGEPTGLAIAPLLLVNFIENAFKHGVKAGITAAQVQIQLGIVNRVLTMTIFNTKPPAADHPELAIREGGGIGVQNVKRRLQILYPKRHTLRINDTRTSYTVNLTIQL